MCLFFLEMSWVRKCRLKLGAVFPFDREYFPHSDNLELLLPSTAFVDKIIRGNIIYNLFDQLVVNIGDICQK